MTDEELAAIEQRVQAATPGPWQVWPGWEYVGGGADLCIGSGQTWLANMNHGACQNYAHHIGCHDDGCKREEDTDICSFTDEITAEQRATAAFIAHAREDVPALLAEVRRLREVEQRFLKARELYEAITTARDEIEALTRRCDVNGIYE